MNLLKKHKADQGDRQNEQLDSEEGSALIIALAMITVMALLLAVVLDFAGTTATSTPETVTQRDNLYEVDGAVDASINSIRGSMGLGSENFVQSCDAGNLFDADSGDSYNITVKCYPQAGSGSAADDVPRYAVLLLGAGGLNQKGNALLTIDGGLYSHGPVTQTASGSSNQRELQVYGDLLAEQACSSVEPNSITSVGGLFECGGGFSDPSGDDPAYQPFQSAAQVDSALSGATMSVDPVPTCPGNGFVRFAPGLYTEVPVAPSGCTHDVWWFRPGFYYFDFPDSASVWEPDATNKYVLGGTPSSGLLTTTPAATVKALPSAGGWRGAACDKEASGVQFVFGGPSRFQIDNGGSVELCGSVDATNQLNQRIVFYGLNTGTRTTAPAADQVRTATAAPTSASGTWVLPGQAQTTNGLYATTTITGNQTASLSFSAFDDMRLGGYVTSAKLRVRRLSTSDKAKPVITVSLPALPNRAAKTFDKNVTQTCLALCTEDIDILSEIGPSFAYQDLNGLTAIYKAAVQGSNTVIESLDSLELVVEYLKPGYEAARCPSSSPGCSVVATTVTQNLFFKGTVYTPSSKLDLNVHNNDTTIFSRGLIAGSLVVDVSAGSKQTDSPFQLPSATSGRKVLLVGQINGEDKVRALVSFQDFNTVSGQKMAFPGYRVTVEKWSVSR